MINLFSQQLITLHQRLKPLLETSFKDVRQFGQKLVLDLDLALELGNSLFQQPNHFSVAMTLVPNRFGWLRVVVFRIHGRTVSPTHESNNADQSADAAASACCC